MPPARRRIRPARSMSLWLTISASAGASLSVERKNCEARMAWSSEQGTAPFYSSRSRDAVRGRLPSNPVEIVEEWFRNELIAGVDHARSRRLSPERRHRPLQLAQRGLLGQARSRSTPGSFRRAASSTAKRRSRRCTANCSEEVGLLPYHVRILGRTSELAALRRAAAVDQARVARQLPGPEADLVSAAAGRPRQRRVACAPASTRSSTRGAGTTTGCRWNP